VRHYTYALIDPRTLKPFYIGKGLSARRFAHFKSSYPVDKRKNPDKMAVIDSIEDDGLKPQAMVLGWFDSEAEAYAAEKVEIAKHGIKNLTNKNKGGAGGHGPQGGDKNTNRLTIKEEAFCQAVGSGLSQYKAYRKAYNVKPKTKRQTIDAHASRVANKDKIAARIAQIRAPVVAQSQRTFEGQLSKFDAAFDLAQSTDQPAAMTGAAREQTRMLDLYPSEKTEVLLRGDALVLRLQKGRQRNAEDKR
jgi:hypothetical protein